MNWLIFSVVLLCFSVCFADFDSKHYREHSSPQYKLAQETLKYYSFRGDEQVLDIGCGDGRITAEIAKMVPLGKVIGVDKSPSMIQLAQESFPAEKNLEFQKQDAASLTFDHSFDLIASFSCFHWVQNKTAAFQQLKKWLKPHGKVIIATYVRCPTLLDPIESVADSKKWRDYFLDDPRPYDFASEADYRRLAAENGLKMVHSETKAEVVKFKGKKGNEDYIRGWVPFLLKLPPELHDAFIEEIGTASLPYAPVQEDGYVYHTYHKIILVLQHEG